MKRVILTLAIAPLLMSARITHAAPDISALRPFISETNFMSLPGYVRWWTLLNKGRWMSREEDGDDFMRATGKPTGTMG